MTTETGARTPSTPRASVSRRTVIGSAWAVPVVVVATAAPAMAASPQSCSYTFDATGSCHVQVSTTGAFIGYYLKLCASRDVSCANATATLTVTVTDFMNRPLTFPVTIPSGLTTGCTTGTVFFNPGPSPLTALSFTFTVNGSAPRPGSVTIPAGTCSP